MSIVKNIRHDFMSVFYHISALTATLDEKRGKRRVLLSRLRAVLGAPSDLCTSDSAAFMLAQTGELV